MSAMINALAEDRGGHKGTAYCSIVGWLLPARFATAAATAAVAAAAATATTTTTITAKASAVAAEATTSAATAATAIFAWLGFVDFQGATADFFAIELIDGCCGFFLGRHFDEGEPSRTSGVAVFHDTR